MSHKVEARASLCAVCGTDSTSVLFACARPERDRVLLGDSCLFNVTLAQFLATVCPFDVGEPVVSGSVNDTSLDHYRLPLA